MSSCFSFQSEKAATPVPKSATPTSSGSTTPGPSAPLKPGAVLKPPHLGMANLASHTLLLHSLSFLSSSQSYHAFILTVFPPFLRSSQSYLTFVLPVFPLFYPVLPYFCTPCLSSVLSSPTLLLYSLSFLCSVQSYLTFIFPVFPLF